MKYAVFILTHGRPDKQTTYKTLLKCGYKGQVYFVVDDMDTTADALREKYGDKVIEFSKREWMQKTDTMDLDERTDVVVYARNAVFEIAKKTGVSVFRCA